MDHPHHLERLRAHLVVLLDGIRQRAADEASRPARVSAIARPGWEPLLDPDAPALWYVLHFELEGKLQSERIGMTMQMANNPYARAQMEREMEKVELLVAWTGGRVLT